MTKARSCAIVAENILITWLVVHPASMLHALELVEDGETAEEVMMHVLDWAHESMEEDIDDAS